MKTILHDIAAAVRMGLREWRYLRILRKGISPDDAAF